jgi:hypothetical protein
MGKHKPAASGKTPAPIAEPFVWRMMDTTPLAALVPQLTRAAFRKRSPAGALLMADWQKAVGPALAARTNPEKLSGTTLTIACSGPTAMELQHQTSQLIGRINAYAGEKLVENLRFVQSARTPVPKPPRLPATTPSPIENFPPGDINDTLARIRAALGGKI